ncbi:hypothetical protein G9A89_021150 [Geosiphon pyriformis]|nr:hypothetical protein G9A89_021150 [Geosiphon pyriformis]
MDLAGSSAGVSGSILTGLESRLGSKKKAHIESVYSHGVSFKKVRKPVVSGTVVDSSAGLLYADPLLANGGERKASWSSEVENKSNNISKVSDLKDIENLVAKETSYIDSNTSGNDDLIDDVTPRKMRTKMYVLDKLPKQPFFNLENNDNSVLELPPYTFLHGLECHHFEPVKSFTLDVELSAVPRKSNIIRSTFTSESSLVKARELTICEKIIVNDNLKKVNIHSNQEVIVKEIPVDLSKLAVDSAFSKFGKIVSIKMQLIGLWQKALVEFESSEVAISRDQHQALLYTLLVGTNAHDLSSLLESYSGKTCYIGHNPNSYVHNRCTVICFGDKTSKLAAIGTIPVFKGVSLHWTGLSLASCTHCKQFGHVMINCSLGKRMVSKQDQICLAGIYKKKSAPIAHLAQVAGGSPSHVISSGLVGADLHSGLVPSSMATDSSTIFHLNDQLAILEHSLELLTDRVSGILVRLESIDLVPVVTLSLSLLPAVSETLTSNVDSDMIMDSALVLSGTPPFIIHDAVVEFSSSSFKVLTAKVGGLETKLIALETSVDSVLDKLNILCSGLGLSVPLGMNNPAKQKDVIRWHKDMNNLISIVTETKLKGKVRPWIATRFDGVRIFTSGQNSGNLGSGVAIVVDNSLARHVCKVSEVPSWLLSIKLLFKNKLSVSILGLYAGASLAAHFSQANEVNSLIAKAVNESSFVVLDGDFNEDGSRRCASFKKCLDLGMVNSLAGNSLAKSSTWKNSRGVVRTINYVFISSNLVNAIYFDTDYQAVCVSVSLGEFLDMHLNALCRQNNFRSATLANAAMFSDKFATSVRFSDLDVMWDIIREVMVLSADSTFKKKWFKDFGRVFSKESLKFHKLELLVSKIIRASRKGDIVGLASFMDCWASLDSVKALIIRDLMDFGMDSGHNAKEANIRSAIDKRMESFEVNKGHIIRSVLKCPFCKVVLDHLVVDSKLVLEPDQIMSKVDVIMEDWTRKRQVVNDMSSDWYCQYWPLEYVFDETFSEVMCPIGFDKLLGVVSVLPDGKTAGLSVLEMLVFLNACLAGESEGVLMNTHPIALIETACKILSKVLSDRISAACSTFNVLCGDNFSVLKSMTTQSPIFAIGSVIEDALEKNRELWLMLQDIRKAYDSVGWEHLKKSLVRIKMCSKFIQFFGSIHRSRTNRVMIDFGLTGGYHIMCEYRLNLYFISKNRRAETQAGLSFFFAVGAFVDDTIWVSNSQAATQHILNVTSKFFQVNDISINNDKTVAIPINSRVSSSFLSISGSPISVAKKGESHRYLGIFFSTEGLSKLSLAKAHSDIHFFVNLVLRKAISDKQFLYLVLAVLQPIINALVHKGLKLKSGLLLDFPSNTLHHPSFYGLKSFSQVQSECKVASLVSFMTCKFGVGVVTQVEKPIQSYEET